jgi:DNA-binding NarL/FixJ family response regulator
MLDTRLSVDIINMPIEEKISKVLNGKNISKRESEILELILQNKKRKDIALELHLSENTVKTYTRSLYNKLEVNNREELFNILTE